MKYFTKLILAQFFLLLMSFSLINGQSVHSVLAGDGTLEAAVVSAASGDIIELVSDGGVYLNSTSEKIIIDKTITIRAAIGLTNKPIIKGTYEGSTSNRFFEIQAGGDLTLIGLELDGTGSDGTTAVAKNAVRGQSTPPAPYNFNLRIYDCVAHDYTEQFMKGFKDNTIDNLIISDCVIYNTGREGILLYEATGKSPVLGTVLIEKSTFYKTFREAVKTKENDPQIIIDHCTFDNCGSADNKRLVLLENANNAVVKNSVFTNNTYSNFIKLYGTSQFYNNIFYNVSSGKISVDGTMVIIADTLQADPIYKDAAANDYTLLPGSPALGFGDDGSDIGDPRWAPQPVPQDVISVSAGDNTLNDAILSAKDGDIIELVDAGKLYTYSLSDKMYIDKKLTIRAKEGLTEKPILRNITPTSSSPRIFEIRMGGELRLKGLDLDGRKEDGGEAFVKQAIRSEDVADTAGAFHFKLIVDDCYIHDSKESLIKGHRFTIGDSVVFRNTIFKNANNEGILFRESTSNRGPDIKYLELTNCTFSHIGRNALYTDFSDPTIRINHCTFDDIAYREDKEGIYTVKVNDTQIKNSIISNHHGVSRPSIKIYGNSSISYTDTFNVGDFSLNNDASVGEGMLGVDPLYKDAANGDYTLLSNSPVRTSADDGLAMGDLRWAIDPNSVVVSISVVGNGNVTLNPAGGVYSPGTEVTLTAVPAEGWGLESWSGISVFPPNKNPVTITVNENVSITAVFKDLTPQVSIITEVEGLGSVTVEPDAGEDKTYNKGTTVTLTAVPNENWKFIGWSGDFASTDNPVSVKLDSNMVVKAAFRSVFPQVVLSVQVKGNGGVTVDPLPILGTYDVNTEVTITANPAQGWKFSGFSGHIVTSEPVIKLKLDANKAINARFTEELVAGGVLEIDNSWDLYDAFEFANNNSSVNTILLTAPGVYTSKSTSAVANHKPLIIKAKEGLATKPVLTNSDPDAKVLDVIRVFDDLMVEGVVFDGGNELSHGMKYAIRLSHMTSDSVKEGSNLTFENCDFINFFEKKNPSSDGHAFKIDVAVKAGDVLFNNCTFAGFGYEAIRISDTEKWATDGALESMTITNCTFTNVDAECVRYYSDLMENTPDAPVIIEHVTVNNSATRAFYLKNSGGAVVRDVIISNSRQSGHGRDGDLMDVQGSGAIQSFVSDIVLFNTPVNVPILSTDGVIDETTIYNIDPMYKDAVNGDYTLLASSHLYGLAHDGQAMGDLRWAVNTPAHVFLNVNITGSGTVVSDPAPVGKSYDPAQVVSLTAVPDSGFVFVRWEGDLTGTQNPVNVTLDVSKTVQAVFDLQTDVEEISIPEEFKLAQNYPNPFNPSTTIQFGLPVSARVTLKVYNVIGQEVASLINDGLMGAGYHNVTWNAYNNYGVTLSTGLYVYRLYAMGSDGKEYVQSMKMMFLK